MNNVKIQITSNYDLSVSYLDCADFNIPITYQIADVRDIGKKNSSYSKTIKFPGTANNNKIFTEIFEVNSVIRFNPSKKANVIVTVDDIPVLYGFIQLTQIDYINQFEIVYEAVLYGAFADLATTLGDRLLVNNTDDLGAATPELDLSFSELAHDPSFDNVAFSWGSTANSETVGYIYALIEQGYGWNDTVPGTTLADLPIRPLKQVFPWIYAKRVWDKIFNAAGFTYTSNFINSSLFKRIFLVGDIVNPAPNITLSSDLQLDRGLTGSNYVVIPFNSVSDNQDQWVPSQYTMTTPAVLSGTTYAFVPGSTGHYEITLNANFTVTAAAPCSIYISLVDQHGNFIPTIPTSNHLYSVTSTFTGTAAPFGTTGSSAIYNLNAGSPYFIISEIHHLTYGTGSDIKILSGAEIDIQLIHGRDLKYMLPSAMKQIDFISSISKMFNLYVAPDRDNPNNLIIEPRDQYYALGATSDWSAKLDWNSDFRIMLASEVAGNKYDFKMTSDSDYLNSAYTTRFNSIYGQKTITVDNDFTLKTVSIEPAFAPTLMRMIPGYESQIFIVPGIYAYDPGTGELSSLQPKPRLLLNTQWVNQFVDPSPLIWYKFYDIGLTSSDRWLFTASYDWQNITGKTSVTADSLNFGDVPVLLEEEYNHNSHFPNTLIKTLYNRYYSSYIKQITGSDSKILRAKFYLTPSDIYKFQFNDTIYLELNGNPSYWYINQIIDFNPVQPDVTEVELIWLK